MIKKWDCGRDAWSFLSVNYWLYTMEKICTTSAALEPNVPVSTAPSDLTSLDP